MERETGNKKFSSVVDVVCEEIKQLEKGVRILKNQQANLTINNKDLEKQRDKLSNEISELGEKKKVIVRETKEEKENILKSAQDKLASAVAKETEWSEKLSELNQKQTEAENIVRSKQGLLKNLNIQKDDVLDKILKLGKLTELIKETIKDM